MLSSLHIKNFLLIDQASICFDPKLSIITGETGAGKSLILDSLSFVLGIKSYKPTKDLQTIVSVEFDISNNPFVNKKLQELDIEIEDILVIRRTASYDGKVKNYINDISVTSTAIKSITQDLIEIYAQHQQQSLLSSSYYLEVTDNFSNNHELISSLNKIYHQYKNNLDSYNQLQNQLQNIEKERDYLEHLVSEVKSLNVYPGEEQELIDKRIMLTNKEKLSNLLNGVISDLEKHHTSLTIASAQRTLIRNNNFSGISFDGAIDYLEKSSIELDEALISINNILEEVNNEQDSLDHIEQRLFAIKAAAKKYTTIPDNFPEFLEQNIEKLHKLHNQDQEILESEQNLKRLKEEYFKLAEKLSLSRKEGAILLEKSIIDELIQLKMPHTRFKINIENTQEISANGMDRISFLFSPNPGIDLAPLGKIASGGELSRFMLGICVVLAKFNQHKALLFDEIDTGLSGVVADAVGSKLVMISSHCQVIAITHQPQIAAKGNTHIKVYKSQENNITNSSIKALDREEKINEIASMISGKEITTEALAAANKLITS